MKLGANELRDEVSISGLKDEEYTLLYGAIRWAASDVLAKGHEYIHRYGAAREDMVALYNKLVAAEDALRSSCQH